MLDMETSALRPDANGFVHEFIRLFRESTGVRRILIYANLDWYRNILRPDDWADADVLLWIARYNGDPGNPGWSHSQLALHQHTQTGTVPGIAGKVDRDATVGSYTLAHLTLDGSTPAPPAPAPPPAGERTYTVVSGDTLSGIAARSGTTAAALAALNAISNPNRIYPGQVLRLTGQPTGSGRRYQIRSGDTLSEIAVRCGTTVAALSTRNGITNPNKIRAGQCSRCRRRRHGREYRQRRNPPAAGARGLRRMEDRPRIHPRVRAPRPPPTQTHPRTRRTTHHVPSPTAGSGDPWCLTLAPARFRWTRAPR